MDEGRGSEVQVGYGALLMTIMRGALCVPDLALLGGLYMTIYGVISVTMVMLESRYITNQDLLI